MGVGGQRHTRENYPIPMVQEAGWAPGLLWTGAEYSSPPIIDPRIVQPNRITISTVLPRPTVAIYYRCIRLRRVKCTVFHVGAGDVTAFPIVRSFLALIVVGRGYVLLRAYVIGVIDSRRRQKAARALRVLGQARRRGLLEV
jgi:hypothetical protein